MKCPFCAEQYCEEHFKVELHACPKGMLSATSKAHTHYAVGPTDRRAVDCPMCGRVLVGQPGVPVDAVVDEHINRGDCYASQTKSACCVSGCKAKLLVRKLG